MNWSILIIAFGLLWQAPLRAEETHHYVIVSPDAYDFAVGRVTKAAYHAARAGSALVKFAATFALGSEAIKGATPFAEWAPLAWAFFVPDVSRWNAARLESRLAAAPGPAVTAARRSLAVDRIVVVKGAKFAQLKGVPQSVKGSELVYLQTSGPLPPEWLASNAWGGAKPVRIEDPTALKLRGELFIDGKPVATPWEIRLEDLARSAPIPDTVADGWRSAIRASDAAEPYALVRWWNQLPVSAFDRIRVEATVEMPDGTRHALGTVASEEGVRGVLEMGAKARVRSFVGLGGPGIFPTRFRKGAPVCRADYAELP